MSIELESTHQMQCHGGLIRLLALGAFVCLVTACMLEDDPWPVLSELSCEAILTSDRDVSAQLAFSYTDADQDLDQDGAVVQWWIDDIAQADLPLDKQRLGTTGTLVLSLSGFYAYDSYHLRFQVRDAAGHVSNDLNAEMDTSLMSCHAVLESLSGP